MILVAAAEHKVGFFGCFQKAVQVGRRMAKVGIHFEHTFVVAFKSPLEARHVSGAEAHLALTAQQVNPRILCRLRFHHIARTVGATVVYHENFEAFVLL